MMGSVLEPFSLLRNAVCFPYAGRDREAGLVMSLTPLEEAGRKHAHRDPNLG